MLGLFMAAIPASHSNETGYVGQAKLRQGQKKGKNNCVATFKPKILTTPLIPEISFLKAEHLKNINFR